MGIDPEELEIFLEELDEILQILEEDIVKLEKQPDNPSILQEIFRCAHTAKGSGAALGFDTLSGLAHAMESVFDRVRGGEMAVSMTLIDVFLQCADTLRAMKESISENSGDGFDISKHISDLDGLLAEPAAVEVAPQGADGGPADGLDENVFTVVAEPAAGCELPNVRATQLYSFLEETGTILTCSCDADMEEVLFPLSITVSTTAPVDLIEKVADSVEELNILDVRTEEKTTAGPAEETPHAPPVDRPPDADGRNAQTRDSVESTVPPAAGETPALTEPADEAPNKPAKAGPKNKKIGHRTVRVDVSKMDSIMDLIGELVINRTRLTSLSRTLEADYETDENINFLNETSDNIESISAQLQENIMKARLLPIENVFNKFPRMVRDLSRKTGKAIELVVEGGKTELDRSVLEEISDPLMHILRNSIDHGLEPPGERAAAGKPETGTVRISAAHVEDHILITIRDDGRGIDPRKVVDRAVEKNVVSPENAKLMKEREALELIFTPGFSTADKVSDISGRGVGMDVVKTNIEKLNGRVTIESAPGSGTAVCIRLPLTLAIIKALLVNVADRVFSIPLISVVQTIRVAPGDIQSVKGNETILYHGRALPLIRVQNAFGIKSSSTCAPGSPAGRMFIVVVSWSGRRVGIVVDSLIGDQEIVIRPLGEYIGEVPGISGAAILGDGRITLIIDVDGFVNLGRLPDRDESQGAR